MWHWMWDGGWGFFGVMHILWWVVLIAGAVILVRALSGAGRPRHDSAIQILRERYARGEIDAAEFAERSKQLKA